MKTIKIIDLLNMISKGEKLPKKIIYHNIAGDTEWEFQDNCRVEYGYKMTCFCDKTTLNDEVEVIEDTPKKNKIDKLYTWFHLDKTDNESTQREEINTNFENITEKIDEIIDYINKGE